MAVEKQVNIKVTETGLDELNKDLVSLDKNIDKVDSSSEKADSSLKKVGDNGGAIATLDALTGGLASRIRDAAEASKLFNTNLKATRAALIASGIGALVVALGVVIAYWDEIKIAVSDTNFLLGKQITQLETITTELEQQISIIDKRIELAELEGKSTEELQKQKLALIEQEQAITQLLIEKLEWQLENEKALAKELTLWEKIKVEALRIVDPTKAAALEAVSQLETNEKTLELQQRINDSKQKQVELEIAVFKAQNPSSSVSGDGVVRGQVSSVGGGLSAAQKNEIETAQIVANKLVDITKNRADQEAIITKALSDTKVDIAYNTLALIGAIAGEGSKVGKAVAAAQATISGIEGVQNAYTTAAKSPITTVFPAYPVVQAGLAAAFSAVQIKKILSTDPTGKTQPNLGGGAGGGGQAPSFNVVGTSGVNQLAQSLQSEEQPLRAYVVSNDITSRQALDRNIQETATID